MKRLLYILPILWLLCSCATQQRSPLRPTTTCIDKAQCDITYGQQSFHTPLYMQTERGKLTMISMQPMLGIEAVRLEATPDSIWIFERLGHHCAALPMNQVKKMTYGVVTYRWLQRIASGERLQGKSQGLTWNFKIDGQPTSIHIHYPAIVYNEPLKMKRINSSKYKSVDIHTLLNK